MVHILQVLQISLRQNTMDGRMEIIFLLSPRFRQLCSNSNRFDALLACLDAACSLLARDNLLFRCAVLPCLDLKNNQTKSECKMFLGT